MLSDHMVPLVAPRSTFYQQMEICSKHVSKADKIRHRGLVPNASCMLHVQVLQLCLPCADQQFGLLYEVLFFYTISTAYAPVLQDAFKLADLH